MITTDSSSTHPNNNAIQTTSIPSTDLNHSVLPMRNIQHLVIIISAITAVILLLISFILFLPIWKNRNGNNNFPVKFP